MLRLKTRDVPPHRAEGNYYLAIYYGTVITREYNGPEASFGNNLECVGKIHGCDPQCTEEGRTSKKVMHNNMIPQWQSRKVSEGELIGSIG